MIWSIYNPRSAAPSTQRDFSNESAAYISLSLYIYIYTHSSRYICIYIYIYDYMCVCVYIYIYIHIHTHTYAYIYIYIYSCRGDLPCWLRLGWLNSSLFSFCANRMTGRSIDAWSNKRTQEKQNDTVTSQVCYALSGDVKTWLLKPVEI